MVSMELPGTSEGLSAELQELEVLMAGVSESLDPETVRVLQKNLGVIERAIEDSRQAPGNFVGSRPRRQPIEILTRQRESELMIES